MRGKYWGTYARYNVALSSQYLTLPPYIDTIEKVAESTVPLTLRGIWHEFNANGYGTRDVEPTGWHSAEECLYRGNYPVIDDIATAGTLTLKCDLASDEDKEVLLLGLDENGNYIRTTQNAAIADGEVVAISQAGTSTSKQYSKVLGIQAPSNLDGQWWLYLGAVVGGTLLGTYQYWDTSPSWKRYLVPFISGTTDSVVLIGKKAFIPVSRDTDYLVVGNLDALKLAGLAIIAEEQHNWSEANLLWNGGTDKRGNKIIGAMQELDYELGHHLGDGEVPTITVMGSSTAYLEPLEPII